MDLDSRQRQLIQDTWRQLQAHPTNVGKQVFLRIFEVEPRVKTAFGLGSTWGDALINNASFQQHADMFVHSIGCLVDSLESVRTVADPFLMAIGADHTERPGFSVQYFDVFIKSLIFVWQKELRRNFTVETRVAWQTLFQYMAGKTKEGYDVATKEEETRLKQKGLEISDTIDSASPSAS